MGVYEKVSSRKKQEESCRQQEVTCIVQLNFPKCNFGQNLTQFEGDWVAQE